MINPSDILQLCRLCLVEDAVNHSIFEESGDLRSIFLKISSCLPVSIHKDDGLPEKICDSCSTKLDSFYQFWNETANAEKQLLQWLRQTTSKKQNQAETSKKMETTEIKQEEAEDTNMDPIDMSSDAQTYILQQQQLPYASVPTDSINTSESDEPLAKRPKRASAVRALEQMESEDEDDPDLAPDNYAKTESDDSDKEEEEDVNNPENPSTSMEEQPGPSGIVKKRVVLDDTPTDTENPTIMCEVKLEEDQSSFPFNCPQCSKGFHKKIKLKKHLLAHSQERPYECDICKKKFKRKYEVTVHNRIHTNTNNFQCDFCLKVLKSKGSLSTHIKRHLKEYVATCEFCGAGFVTKQEYQNHVGSKHGRSIHVCDICNRPCYDRAALLSHRARHEEGYETNQKHRCELCNKTFLQEKYLKHHHMRIHKNGGQRYICDHCGKRVNSKRSLRDHLLIHEGLKPVECPQCDKKFALKTTLNLHLRTHSGERPYKCQDCGKSFTQRSSFKTHVRYHTGERPYQCDFCEQAFVSRGAMTLHIRSRH